MLTPSAPSPSSMRQTRQRGMSMVELMIGITIGLFIISGTVSLFISNLGNSRKMMTEARINQNLRSAADLIARDLRRAGYWANAISGTVATGTSNATTSNPYVAVTASGSQITYDFARDGNDVLNAPEQFGFRLNAGKVDMKINADNWQPITSPTVVTITELTITPIETELPSGDICQKPCAAGSTSAEGTKCPTLTTRQYDVRLRGIGVADTTVTRELQSSVRVRNDKFAGACPL